MIGGIFNLLYIVTGSPKFSPRQVSTPMSTRPQDQLRQGQLNLSYQQAQMNQSMGIPNQSMMPQTYQQNIMTPLAFNQSSFMGNVTQQPRDNYPMQVEYSAKHNGLYIYVGRILSPIWNLKCVTKSVAPDNKELVS